MSKSFLEAARQGKNDWWRYLVVIASIQFYWWILSGLTMIGVAIVFVALSSSEPSLSLPTSGEDWQQFYQFWQTPSIALFVASTIPFIVLCILIVIGVKKVHQRQFLTLIRADASINYKRLFSGFGVWWLIIGIPTIVVYFLEPHNFLWTFDPKQWFLFLPIALLLVPVQTSVEEFFFRGYLLQGLGLITKHPITLILVTSAIFAIPHFGNPEMQRDPVWVALSYLTWGIFFAAITLKDNGLELALGVHAANNIFLFTIVNTADSVLPSPSLFTIQDAGDPKISLCFFLAEIALFYYLFFGRRRKPKLSQR
jgi:uncharacterized protein